MTEPVSIKDVIERTGAAILQPDNIQRGAALDAKEREAAEAEAQTKLARRREQLLAEIPRIHRGVCLENIPLELRDWTPRILLDGPEGQKGWILAGSTGRGKTGAAWAIYRYLVEHDFPGALPFVKCAALWEISYHDREGTEEIKALIDAPLLFLDDFGATKGTPSREDRMLRILDERYDHERPTIITTNLIPSEFSKTQNGRIVSRLLGQTFRVLPFAGVDRRDVPARRGGLADVISIDSGRRHLWANRQGVLAV